MSLCWTLHHIENCMEQNTEHVRCLIVGSGPAGYTAAIYAARANLKPVEYCGIQPGGQLTQTTTVENFPGYPQGVDGNQMMMDLREQAEHFGPLLHLETVLAEVPAGKMMSLTLADGTVIDLNSGARLEYPAIFYGKNRDVKLEGEAMFKVSHDPSRPFTVSTFAADIEVLGTEFNVMADSREGIFSTSLIEGSVRIRDISGSGTAYTLVPDQSIVLDHGRFRIEDGLDPQALYWTEGLINIAGIPFEELMRRFERAFDTDIVIDRQEMPVIECTSGEIRVSDGIGNALRILQHVADFEYVIEPGENLIIIR